MTITDEISIIANQLANQGKKPTVALIKAKLSSPAPLPVLIQTLRAWQHDPEFITLQVSKQSATEQQESNAQQTLAVQIENAVAHAIKPLQVQISALTEAVEKLSKS